MDDWVAFNPGLACPQAVHDRAETASMIRLSWASKIAEIHSGNDLDFAMPPLISDAASMRDSSGSMAPIMGPPTLGRPLV